MKLRPLQDRLIVKRSKAKDRTEGGLYIPDNAKEQPVQGEVLAVGGGRVLDDGTVRPLDVKPGDVVLFGKFAGQEVAVIGEDHVMLREEDVLAVVAEP